MVPVRLGDIRFGASLAGSERQSGWEYEEHRVIEGKPRLQWLASNLEERTLELTLHRAFGDPEATCAALRELGEAHTALPLAVADEQVGTFVLTGLVETHRHLREDGAVEWVDVRLTLREYVPPDPLLVVQLQARRAAGRARGALPAEGEPCQSVDDHWGDEELYPQSFLPPDPTPPGADALWDALFGAEPPPLPEVD
jgi:phage protein U